MYVFNEQLSVQLVPGLELSSEYIVLNKTRHACRIYDIIFYFCVNLSKSQIVIAQFLQTMTI